MNQILAELIQQYLDGCITGDEFAGKVAAEAYVREIYQHVNFLPAKE